MGVKKYIPIAATGYTKDFFEMDITEEMNLELVPKLEVEGYHTATIVILLNDDGLKEWGIEAGSYLLFSQSADTYQNQVLLVRQEGRYIIRIGATVDPLETILITPKDIHPLLHLNSENIRIVGVMNGFILPHDGLKIIIKQHREFAI